MRSLFWLGLLVVLAACGADQGLPAEPLRFSLKTLPPAYLGEPYRVDLEAAGGVRPYTYEFQGKLPEGLSFRDGRIEGTPKKKGEVRFEVTIKDAALSAVTRTFTLKVTDPPPPRFQFVLPPAAVEDPFIWVAKLEGRRTLGFQARFDLEGLRPELETLKVTDRGLFLVRYDEKTRVLGLDLAFFKPVSKGEVFRLTLVPEKKTQVKRIPYQARFLDAKGAFYPASEKVRFEAGEGRYGFSDLVALAKNWGKKASKDKPLEGDLNGDGVVNEADFEVLKASYRWDWWTPKKKGPAQAPSSGTPRKSSMPSEKSASLP